jgi:hypothetical protein
MFSEITVIVMLDLCRVVRRKYQVVPIRLSPGGVPILSEHTCAHQPIARNRVSIVYTISDGLHVEYFIGVHRSSNG